MKNKIIHAHNYGHKNLGDDAMAQNVFNIFSCMGCEVKTITTYCAPKGQRKKYDYPSLSGVINNYNNMLIKIFIVAVNRLGMNWMYSIYVFVRLEIIINQVRFYKAIGVFPGLNKDVKHLIDGIKSSDVYVRSGSGSLNDIWFWSSLMPQFTEVRIAKLFGLKVVFTGQGVGPITGKYRREIFASFLQSCDLFVLRDRSLSKKLINVVLGRDCDYVYSVGDDAAMLELLPIEETLEEINTFKNLIVCQFRGTDYENEIGEVVWVRLAKQLDILTNQGYKIVIISFSNGRVNDLKVAKELAALCKERVVVLEDVFEPEQAKWLISKAYMTIGQSYHFGVFSLIENVPFVGFYNNNYYDLKLNGLLEWYDKTDWCVSSSDLEKIPEMIEEIENSYSSYVIEMKNVNAKLKQNLKQLMNKIVVLND